MSRALGEAPSPTQLRHDLLKMVLRDLWGPEEGDPAGETEVVTDRSVRDRYLVGMLAPIGPEPIPEEQDSLELGGRDTFEDGSADGTVPAAQGMFPSSFGMTFAVDPDAASLVFSVRWGRYAKEGDEEIQSPRRPWRRQQFAAQSPPIAIGSRQDQWQPFADIPVFVDYHVRKAEDHWSVTAFLVNKQEARKRTAQGSDSLWLFQAELSVSSPDGRAIFHRRPNHRQTARADATDHLEHRKMEMLYRQRVEFATGHGVGVHVEVSDGVADRAVRISTAAVPRYEVPHTTPLDEKDLAGLAGLVRDMKELAETPTP